MECVCGLRSGQVIGTQWLGLSPPDMERERAGYPSDERASAVCISIRPLRPTLIPGGSTCFSGAGFVAPHARAPITADHSPIPCTTRRCRPQENTRCSSPFGRRRQCGRFQGPGLR